MSFVGNLKSKELSITGDSSEDSTESSCRGNSGAWRLHMGHAGRIDVGPGGGGGSFFLFGGTPLS